MVTFAILVAFCAGIFYENTILPAGFIPNEDQGTIYAIIQTPPGSTLEKTNEVSQRLLKICEEIDGVEGVSSLAGYEIMTEGRGSNADTCISTKGYTTADAIAAIREVATTTLRATTSLSRDYPTTSRSGATSRCMCS